MPRTDKINASATSRHAPAQPAATQARVSADAAAAGAFDGSRYAVTQRQEIHRLFGPAAPVQRKITIPKLELELTPEVILGQMGTHGVLADADAIYGEVLRGKPASLLEDPRLKFVDVEKRDFQLRLLSEWHARQEVWSYEHDAAGYTRLLKHLFKWYLHSELNWRSVGVAEYMTGDATGLALAPLVDPALTIKVLSGEQEKRKSEGVGSTVKPEKTSVGTEVKPEKMEIPDLVKPEKMEATEPVEPEKKEVAKPLVPTFLDRKTKELPGYFESAVRLGQVVVSDTDKKKKYTGTQHRYGQKYNEHIGKNIKPWNKETWEATDVIGKALSHEEQRERLQAPIRLGSSEADTLKKTKVAEFKETVLDPRFGAKTPLLFLWGRTSGQTGGAHPELDSHTLMQIQLAKTLVTAFPGHTLVLVGDPITGIESVGDLQKLGIANRTAVLGKFWNDDKYGKYLADRNAQRYLFQLFSEQNGAVSIGMRSGSLEGMALLGMKVIFLDDLGNNAEERMEFWAGSAAKGRGALIREGAPEQAQTEHETKNAGPLPNYKRVGTLMALGSHLGSRHESLASCKLLMEEMSHAKDTTGRAVVDAQGTQGGKKALEPVLSTKYAVFHAEKIPPDVKLVAEYLGKLAALYNSLLYSGYRGKETEVKGSVYQFGQQDVASICQALKTDLPGQEDAQKALLLLDGLTGKLDVTNAPLLAAETSDMTRGLLGSLLSKVVAPKPKSEEAEPEAVKPEAVKSEEVKPEKTEPIASAFVAQPLVKEDAAEFVKRFNQRAKQLLGSRTEAKAGTKFARAEFDRVYKIVCFMLDNSLLQPDELSQIVFLTKHLMSR